MEKLKLRPYVIPVASTIIVLSIFVSSFFLQTSTSLDDTNKYVDDVIIGDDIPVINVDTIMINPYTAQDVSVAKDFYDYNADEESQEKSIVEYDDTYMQNTGIDFTSENTFDVVSVLDGEVINIEKSETLGNVIKIEHEDGYISVYQSLSETSVEKGSKVSQGQVIGKSGENKLDKESGNHLHFELYINGQMVNPINYLNKSLKSN